MHEMSLEQYHLLLVAGLMLKSEVFNFTSTMIITINSH